jgi:hypothetical protein
MKDRAMIGFSSTTSVEDARAYVQQLFTRKASTGDDQPATSTGFTLHPEEGPSATDRALEAITTIIWKMQHPDSSADTSVKETDGYVFDARGSENDDEINMKAVSAYGVDLAEGDDTLTLKAGSIGSVLAGEGDDSVNLAAKYIGDIDGGDGQDTLTMASDIIDGVDGADGDDTIKASGKTILNLTGGAGDDAITLEGERIFAAGGAGDDTISIKTTADHPAELSFAAGDGNDSVSANGPLDIRFTGAGYSADGMDAPGDLEIEVTKGQLVIRSNSSDDSITIAFDESALKGAKPSYSFVTDQGDYVLKIR